MALKKTCLDDVVEFNCRMCLICHLVSFWSLWSQISKCRNPQALKNSRLPWEIQSLANFFPAPKIWFACVCDSNRSRKSWCFLLYLGGELLRSFGFCVESTKGKRRRDAKKKTTRLNICVSRDRLAASGDSCSRWGHAAKPFNMKLPVLFNFARQFFILWMVTRGKKSVLLQTSTTIYCVHKSFCFLLHAQNH